MAVIPSTDELKAMVASGAAENVLREFKAATWERNDAGKRECLKDITALANTQGGLILVGIAEENNAAKEFAPLTVADAESERGRINDLITNGVEPRLYGVDARPVEVDGGVVLAISVPRSPSRPHRVSSQGWNKIWLRNSTGAYEANMADLRNLFLQSAEITERAERYHRERIPLMKAGDVQPDLAQERHGIAMHVIPADAFSSSVIVDPKRALELFENFKPIGASGYSWRFTFDGFLVYRAAGERGGSFGYTLVGRSGLVEAIKVRISNGDQIPIAAVELQLIQAVQQYAAAMFAAGVLPPLYAYITLYGVGGQRLIFRGQSPFADEQEPITRQDLHLPAAVIEEATTEAVAAALKPAFDAIWNAGGYEGSLSYKGGAWAQNGAEL